MAVLAKPLFLALLVAASTADSADCGAEDATSLIQMKSTLEQGDQKKVIAKDEGKEACTPPVHLEGSWIGNVADYGNTADYAQCLENNCEDASKDALYHWSGGQFNFCKDLTTMTINGLPACDDDADRDITGTLFDLHDMKVWKMCGATCKEQCNAARLEKKEESSRNAVANIENEICNSGSDLRLGAAVCWQKPVGSECKIKDEVRSCVKTHEFIGSQCECLKKVSSESLVDEVMSCASNCEDKKGQENYMYECRQECLDGVKELAAAEKTARVVKVAEYCGDKYLQNNMDLSAIFDCCHDKFPKNGHTETDEYLKCKDVLQVIRKG